MEQTIYYIGPQEFANLEYDSPTGFTDNSKDTLIDGETNLKKAVIEHPNAERHSVSGFVDAFNDGAISDQGWAVLVEEPSKEEIIVEVRGGIAYTTDPRIVIKDYDNEKKG